ncbi:hypothetical protein Daus18300_003857 [Diaporthe australafricana]|uniref:Helicase C-terminal domain-containing protein n=1 Tax=Diaporthe australafricana TaxID=127596 RepID=A0ABR3XD03_9PEZI
MSSPGEALKRASSPEAQEAQPCKRLKQQDCNDNSDAAPEAEETAAEAGSSTSEDEAPVEPRANAAVDSERDELDPVQEDASPSIRLARKRKTAEKHSKWTDTVNRFSTHGNTTGLFSEELQRKGHNSRPSMLPDERRELMEDLGEASDTSELQGHDTQDENQQPKVDLDFQGDFSAAVDSVKDAAAFLGVDLELSKVSPKSQLKLRIDQIQNIALMVKMAEGILKGCVNANDHGTGKSIEALASVFFLAERRETCPDFGAHKVTFILCVPQALRGWQEVYENYFSDLLTLYIFSDSLLQSGHSKEIDPVTASALDEFLGALDPSDPQTSRIVILSTYGELSSPEFLAQRAKQNVREKELSLRGSKLTEENTEALKVLEKPELYDLNFNPKMIGTLIADEAHEIKHPRSQKAQAAYLLDADIHFLLTASPIDNKISDFRGLLFALYKSNTWQINWPQKKSAHIFLKMFDENFDPFKDTGSGNFVPSDASPEYLEALRSGRHLWRLNPHAYRWLGHKLNFGPEFARRVLGSIFRLCLLRRGMISSVELPNGGSSTISEIIGLPAVSIRTVSVKMTEDEKESYDQLAGPWFEKIFRSGDGTAPGAARVFNSNETAVAGFNKFFDTSLSQITSDIGLADVLQLESLSSGPTLDKILPSAGALLRINTDGGMSFYHKMTRLDSDPLEPSASRSAMIRYLVRRSPKARWLLVKLEELRQKGEKAVIYCVHPLTQWFLELVCTMAEFNFLSLRSKPKHGDQVMAAVVDDFNDPAKRIDFLLSTMRVLGSGVDLHADCRNMIIFELPDNIPAILSAIRRIRRVGQTRPQNVWILTLDESYDDYTLHRLFRKYATSLLAFGVLGDKLGGVAKRLQSTPKRQRHTMHTMPGRKRVLVWLAILEHRFEDMKTRDLIMLLAAGEVVRQQLGAQYVRSLASRGSRDVRTEDYRRLGLYEYAGERMVVNTRTGQLILEEID